MSSDGASSMRALHWEELGSDHLAIAQETDLYACIAALALRNRDQVGIGAFRS